MLQRWIKRFFAVVICLGLSLSAFAKTYEKGVHYFALPASVLEDSVVKQYQQSTGKSVVVLEFFSFGCGACSYFEPMMETFAKELPGSAGFEQVPVIFHPQWEILAQAFYMLELMPHAKVPVLKKAIFDAIHKDRRDASQIEVLKVIFARQGISKEEFESAFNSFGLMQKREFAKTLVKSFKVDEIPMVVVIGPGGAFYTKPSVPEAGMHFVDIIRHMVAQANR